MKRGASRLEGCSALVFGASGFIGRWVTAALERAGARVIPAVRDVNVATVAFEMAEVGAKPRAVDVTDFEAVERLVRREEPEFTFNLAGYGVDRSERDPSLARRINAELPARLASILLDGAAAGNQTLVHTGSALEYGGVDRVGEDDPTVPTTDYGHTKLAGTQAVTAASDQGLRAITARLFTVFGPGEHSGRLLPSLLEAAKSEGVVDLTEGLQERDFTFVDDVVEALLRLAEIADPPAIVNVATGRLQKVRDFVTLAARELRIDERRLRFGALQGRDEMAHAPVPVERLRSLTTWVPNTSIPEGVRRTGAVLGIREEVA